MKRAIFSIALAIAACGFTAVAQEHPEHPTGKTPPKAKSYSMDELESAIKSEIETTQAKNGGYYKMEDKETGKTLSMKLDHVHRERLAQLDAKTYFACTDFKTDDNHVVDVDFFMKDDGEKLAMSDAAVHKIDGKPRYNWKEKDG